MILTTKRLNLRPFTPTDQPQFALLNADTKVMQHFPNPLDQAASSILLKSIMEKHASEGFCFLAASAKADGQFIGMIGISKIDEITRTAIPGQPSVEIGWRIKSEYWGQGYASEAAKACRDYAWQTLQLSELVSFTAPQNTASRRVMEKIGMSHDTLSDFAHPKLPPGHPLSAHVLYRSANPLL